MADEQFILRRVAWQELCPWLMIFRCFRLSIRLPILFLATLGALANPWGGELADLLFGGEWDDVSQVASPRDISPSASGAGLSAPGSPPLFHPLAVDPPVGSWRVVGLDRQGPSGVYRFFVEPIWRLFDRSASTSQFLANLWNVLWNIGIWSFVGGAITRVAIVQLGRDERVSLVAAVRHAARNWMWYAAAPLFPLLGIALLLVPLALLGILLRMDIFVLVSGILWPVVLLAGLGMAVLLLGWLGGWPLMWPTISAEENSDAFEAFNRSFSYVFQRPWQYLLYGLIAWTIGEFAWVLVDYFATAVIALNHWALSFGAGNARVDEVLGGAENPSTLLWAGAKLIGWWDTLVRIIAQAFNYSYFLCAASAIYLLMRREVDQTDFDDVYVTDELAREGLPPLRPGPEGVPEVAEPTADDKEAVS